VRDSRTPISQRDERNLRYAEWGNSLRRKVEPTQTILCLRPFGPCSEDIAEWARYFYPVSSPWTPPSTFATTTAAHRFLDSRPTSPQSLVFCNRASEIHLELRTLSRHIVVLCRPGPRPEQMILRRRNSPPESGKSSACARGVAKFGFPSAFPAIREFRLRPRIGVYAPDCKWLIEGPR